MHTPDEIRLVRVLTALVQVHHELGDEAYLEAANAALVAIARTALHRAEVEVGMLDAEIIPFPPGGRGGLPRERG